MSMSWEAAQLRSEPPWTTPHEATKALSDQLSVLSLRTKCADCSFLSHFVRWTTQRITFPLWWTIAGLKTGLPNSLTVGYLSPGLYSALFFAFLPAQWLHDSIRGNESSQLSAFSSQLSGCLLFIALRVFSLRRVSTTQILNDFLFCNHVILQNDNCSSLCPMFLCVSVFDLDPKSRNT